MSLKFAASRCRRVLLFLALASAPLSAFGQAVAAPLAAPLANPLATESVAIPADALPASTDVAVEKGLELESLGRWADAVAHYEQSLRATPGDRRLEWRFDVARLP